MRDGRQHRVSNLLDLRFVSRNLSLALCLRALQRQAELVAQRLCLSANLFVCRVGVRKADHRSTECGVAPSKREVPLAQFRMPAGTRPERDSLTQTLPQPGALVR